MTAMDTSYQALARKYPRGVKIAKCSLTFLVLYLLFTWFYTNIEEQIDKKDKYDIRIRGNKEFDKWLKTQGKDYADAVERE